MMRLQLSSAGSSEASASAASAAAGGAGGGGGAAGGGVMRGGGGGSPLLSASNDLMGNSLASYFSQLFEKPPVELNEKRKEKKKCKKCKKTTKTKDKRKMEPMAEFSLTLPEVSVSRTPSPFAVFAAIRATCLENRQRQAALMQFQSAATWKEIEEGYSSDISPDDPTWKKVTLPKIVGIGLHGVFEIIRESQTEFPSICKRALESLLNILQGLQPEELMKEPTSVMEPMFQTLLDLASSGDVTATATAAAATSSSTAAAATSSGTPAQDNGEHIRALACACLLSFAAALGDTGKLLQASSAMLMSPKGSEKIVMPSILVSLQRSVVSVMLGRTDHPDCMSQGVLKSSNLDTFNVVFKIVPKDVYSLASDGVFIYLHSSQGIYKVGSGYAGTIKGRVYHHRPDFCTEPGWLGYAKNSLYFKAKCQTGEQIEICEVDVGTLAVKDTHTVKDQSGLTASSPYLMFSDGTSLGVVTVTNNDNFVIKFLNFGSNSLTCGQELPLKLARKCVDLYGASMFREGEKQHQVDFGCEDEAVDLQAGKDFAFMLSHQGKLYFSGKSVSIGHKQPSSSSQWNEVSISRSPKVTQVAIGHEGQHSLIVTEDGVAYFTGTARRGEDGDQTKNRRQPKPAKPKKFARVEGIYISHVACNNGTSALVSREGELYVFGKDSSHADFTTGLVTDLKGSHVTQVEIGKAHLVALTKGGEVFSFGMNNKGQCGRDFPSVKDGPNATTALGSTLLPSGSAAGIEGQADDANSDNEVEQAGGLFSICSRDKHNWKHDQCMVCVLCGDCTGYGSSCVSSGRPDRNPGTLCGCGSGDSGCSECGICRTCAGDEGDVVEVTLDLPDGAAIGEMSPPVGGADNHFDALAAFGHGGQDLRAKHRARVLAAHERKNYRQKLIRRSMQKLRNGGRSRRHTEKEEREAKRGDDIISLKSVEIRNRERNLASNSAGTSDVEKEAGKLASLAPAKIALPKDVKIIQISSGLHHTLMVSSKGEVFVFGSNTHGQLGLLDLIPRGAPTKLPLQFKVTSVAAGSYHSVLLTASGEVYTFGSHQKGQLGREAPEPAAQGACSAEEMASQELWYAKPAAIPNVGPKFGRTATWIGSSSDQTFIKVDESLINAQSLVDASIMASSRYILLLPTEGEHPTTFNCLAISRSDGFCRSFGGAEQECFRGKTANIDPVYNALWSYDHQKHLLKSFLPIAKDCSSSKERSSEDGGAVLPTILSPELALPITSGCLVSRNQASLNLLSCLDTLNQMPEVNLTSMDEDQARSTGSKNYTKEDFLVVNRFDSHGGGWGYSGHSIEAIRFMVDTDILLGGYGLFGGRGEYIGKIKLFDIGADGGDQESDGELLAESEEITYECGARQKYPILFDEPVPIQAGRWYIAWARVSGPSSDCGSSGQTQVISEEQIQFNFKSSKKSNNGTDVNAGQVPQLLYKVVTTEIQGGNRRYEAPEPVCILSSRFAKTITAECFHPLMSLIQWSWNAYKAGLWDLIDEDDDHGSQAMILDLERFIFIARACLRLIVTYTHEVYPSRICSSLSRPVPESQKLAEAMYDCRTLLQQMLKDPLPALEAANARGATATIPHLKTCHRMTNLLLADAHRTFVACFHAFYPTGYLKWSCLCNLLAMMETSATCDSPNIDRLLAAVLDALCQPMVKLRNTFPITYSPEMETRCRNLSPSENLLITASMIQAGDNASQRFPILNELMNYQSHLDGIRFASWSFREVLDRLLAIVSLPVKQCLKAEPVSYSKELEEKSCHIIAAVISELATQSVTCDNDIQSLGGRILHITPNRFTRTSNSRTWNTGNGSPDAICFSVDRAGIFIVGCSVYGGMGTYDYELELLDDQSSNDKDPNRQSQRWNSLEIAHGSYSSDDCVGDIAELKFEKPVAIKSYVKYALRLRNHGGRTSNGDAGVSSVKGPDGTVFNFSSCSLSFNGTNPTRGQLPQLLYFNSPQENDVQSTTRSISEMYSRRTALSMTSTIVKTVASLLVAARDSVDEKGLEVLNSAPVITKLMPHVLASVANLTKSDPHSAVQIISFIQDLLPSVAALNNSIGLQGDQTEKMDEVDAENEDDYIPSPHYAWVESDHPYKSASVSNYKVTFPPSVHWMSIEFDSKCATAQMEDVLQMYIPSPASAKSNNNNNNSVSKSTVTSPTEGKPATTPEKYIPVLKKLYGTSNWPRQALILPGNEILFSLETASDYVKDEKTNQYGFRCLVVGYEAVYQRDQGLKNLEMELAYLGGLCSASLMKRNLPLASNDEGEEDMEIIEESATDAFEMHSSLLSKGFALDHAPSVQMALDGIIPFSCHSNEMIFLRNFVHCVPNTSGGRLARWLQPESYIDVEKCKVMLNDHDMRCNWPTIITVVTRDQYGDVVQVPNMRVEVKAVPVDEMNQSGSKLRKATTPDAMTFGGHRAPNLDPKYEVTVKDKMFYHAITVHKSYDNYSFEELRFASPALQRQSENMLVRANNDGTYSANWTPGNIGGYRIHVTVDGCDMAETFKVEVKDPPQGIVPPPHGDSKKTCGNDSIHRLRKFIAKPSAGLRVRIHPTLQSEQIGVIPVDGTVSIVDELHNSDGIWVRLGPETMVEASPNHAEGWCLQYNQHLEKTLMIPVAEPKGSKVLPAQCQPGSYSQGQRTFRVESLAKSSKSDRKKLVARGPGQYTVVKCGASGHNIRSNPNLSAAPIGMLNLGDAVNIISVKEEGGEVWVQLDIESIEKHCFSCDGDAWSLAVSSTDIQYLESEAEIEDKILIQQMMQQPLPIGVRPYITQSSRADLIRSVPSPQDFGGGISRSRLRAETGGGAGSSGSGGGIPRRKSEIAVGGRRHSPVQFDFSVPLDGIGGGGGSNSMGKQGLRRESSPSPSRRAASPADGRKPSFFSKLFKGDTSRRGTSASPPMSRKSVAPPPPPPPVHFNKDLPPELQGVSVKELVKVIGESRANGNGVTPPGTPNSMRKAAASSRSVSPQVSRSQSFSPVSIRSGQHTAASSQPIAVAAKSPLSQSPLSGTGEGILNRQDSSQSDTSALVSSIARDFSQSPGSCGHSHADDMSASPTFSGKSEHPPQVVLRASSKSPQRRRKEQTRMVESNDSIGSIGALGYSSEKSGMISSVSSAEVPPLPLAEAQNATTPGETAALVEPVNDAKQSAALPSASSKKRAAAPIEKPTGLGSKYGSPLHEFAPGRGVVKEAMSPSVAESIRSVFAAFVWHEGIVHDTMAIASYLKFHPSLSKEGSLSAAAAAASKTETGSQKEEELLRRQQRHSVEVISATYLRAMPQILDPQLAKSAINANANRNLAAAVHQQKDVLPESRALELHLSLQQQLIRDSNLPPTMRLLVMLWEEIRSYCRHAILQQVILTSPLHFPSRKSDRRDRDRKNRKTKRKSSSSNLDRRELGEIGWPPLPSGSGHEYMKASMPAASVAEKEAFYQLCDMCGHYFQHPITYHMRVVHGGCGNPAGGKGYNSGGNYCGGWAGNCGDGGVGGSSWYLICEKCRDEHIKNVVAVPPPPAMSASTKSLGAESDLAKGMQNQAANSVAPRLKRRPFSMTMPAGVSKLVTSPSSQLNSHNIMNNNAMFLLDLASASNSNLVPPSLRKSSTSGLRGRMTSSSLSAVSELSHFDPNPFPLVPFQCFNALGMQSSHLKLLNEELILDEGMKRNDGDTFLKKAEVRHVDKISPPAQFKTKNVTIFEKTEEEEGIREEGSSNISSSPSKKPFGRSVSVGCSPGGSWQQAQSPTAGQDDIDVLLSSPSSSSAATMVNDEVRTNNRKRNSSYENREKPEGPTSSNSSQDFLSNPSPALQKLFSPSNIIADILQRPVMSFVLQWNDLESIQVAMTLALRKAACRTYAMQALNWLLRSVSQPACLHDLLWCFVGALEAKNDLLVNADNAANDEKTKEKKNKRNALAQQQPALPSVAAAVAAAVAPLVGGGGAAAAAGKDRDVKELLDLCEHPTSDIYIAGEAIQPLPDTFHSLLQTISDLMLLLPVGSSLQQIAMRCWGIKFKQTDHQFLHQSHVFSTISRILSRSEELDSAAVPGNSAAALNNLSFCESEGLVERITDISSSMEIKVSSRPAMVGSLSDNSTETFWESGDEDRNKSKWVTLSLPAGSPLVLRNITVHIDNGRDLGNKVSSVIFKAGKTLEEAELIKQTDVESRFAGWVSCFLDGSSQGQVVKIELKGPDNTLRIRQVKVLGGPKEDELNRRELLPSGKMSSDICSIQQRNCEAETLRVFRLITGQVFGRLLEESHHENEDASNETYLKEHVVGILFSRSKLTHLQKQVCAHIVQAIKKESSRFRDDWEVSLCSGVPLASGGVGGDEIPATSDTYCFEMLSLVLALSGSSVGRSYLAQQFGLIKDLLALLHTGSGRVQRQVIALFRRVLPKVSPQHFASILGISTLPPKDFGILTAAAGGSRSSSGLSTTDSAADTTTTNVDVLKPGILDVFLSCIAKALTLQVKSKGKGEGGVSGGRSMCTVSLGTSIHPRGHNIGERWWLRGSMSKKIAEEIIHLLKDMSGGKLSEDWSGITKSAIAENILNLTRLDDKCRESSECLKYPVLWLALASLCVLDRDHVEGLSSGDWGNSRAAAVASSGAAAAAATAGEGGPLPPPPRPTCENHDDSETLAIIMCDQCGNLCGDCDRYLHLNRRTKEHQRQVFKEEEEAIKVDLHEGCGRTKLFWVMALADSLTLKAMVEFREGGSSVGGRTLTGGPSAMATIGAGALVGGQLISSSNYKCRFCGRHGSSDLPVMDSVCSDKECVEFSRLACQKILTCGHFCGGIADETSCMPCLHGCSGAKLKQDADDMCMICFIEALCPVPSIQLECGHVFHFQCCALVLEKRWLGPRITFGFRNCPICKTKISHEALGKYLDPIDQLYQDVHKKALMRLEYEGLSRCEAVVNKGARFFGDPSGFAIERYAYYVCFKCGKAYYGGEAQCDAAAAAGRGDDYDPQELVCGGCSDVSQAQMCPKHGTDYLEYKCRYCCSVAVFFCFGTTHFCNACHDDFQRVANLPKQDLPQCPVAPKCVQMDGEECPLHVKHPPTGEEFALGCGVCRNAHTF